MNATTTAAGLRERREALGVTRVQLAIAAKCSVTQLQNLEAGLRPARSAVLERAEKVLAYWEQDAAEPASAAA
jgi:transcriptional regulator with XRE-family HTH domain